MDDKVCTHVALFNKTFRALFNSVLAKGPNAELEMIRDRAFRATSIDPQILVQKIGPYLFKYNHFINDNDAEGFLGSQVCESELSREASSDAEQARRVFVHLKAVYETVQDSVKVKYMKAIEQLLDQYIEYACAVEKTG